MTNTESRTSWWKTLPGILSGIAATVSAIATLLLALHQMGYLGASSQGNDYLEGSISGIDLPAYVILDSAHPKKNMAQQRLVALNHAGYSNSGFFWIPDFEYLSGQELFQVYVGPFENLGNAALEICKYNKKFDVITYGLKLSSNPGREEFRCEI